jgi:hypothetical protein
VWQLRLPPKKPKTKIHNDFNGRYKATNRYEKRERRKSLQPNPVTFATASRFNFTMIAPKKTSESSTLSLFPAPQSGTSSPRNVRIGSIFSVINGHRRGMTTRRLSSPLPRPLRHTDGKFQLGRSINYSDVRLSGNSQLPGNNITRQLS